MHEAGYKIIGVATFPAAVFNKPHQDPELLDYVAKHKTVQDSRRDSIGTRRSWSRSATSIAARPPKASSPQERHNVKAKLLVEGANSPTTPPADEHSVLSASLRDSRYPRQRGFADRPYFEWVQGRQLLLTEAMVTMPEHHHVTPSTGLVATAKNTV